MSKEIKTRLCKCGCGKSIQHKHPNAKFYNQRHKDSYHNWTNPRGKFAHLSDMEEDINDNEIDWYDWSESS